MLPSNSTRSKSPYNRFILPYLHLVIVVGGPFGGSGGAPSHFSQRAGGGSPHKPKLGNLRLWSGRIPNRVHLKGCGSERRWWQRSRCGFGGRGLVRRSSLPATGAFGSRRQVGTLSEDDAATRGRSTIGNHAEIGARHQGEWSLRSMACPGRVKGLE